MAWDRKTEEKHGKAMAYGGLIFGLIFAIFWCIAAASMGAWFMLIFGIPFVGMIIHRIYLFRQMTKKEESRTQPKEIDPWERPTAQEERAAPNGSNGFCPYCGGSIQEGFEFCPKCGRRQPQ